MTVPRRGFIGLIFVAFSLVFIDASLRVTGGDPMFPGPFGDAQDFDAIATQLVHGRGFGIDDTDEDWRRPYELHNDEDEYSDLLARHTPYRADIQRPPLVPFVLACVYWIFGRNFLVWRIIDSLFTAFGLALICDVAWRTFGSAVALMSAAVMFLSHTYVYYVAAEAMVSEPLAIVLVAAVLWVLVRYSQSLRTRDAVLAGVVFALLCLTRAFFLPWLPFLAIFVWWCRRALKPAALFLVIAMAIQLPWAIRNGLVTHAFLPFGTLGGTEIRAGYSDLAVAHRGVWWIGSKAQTEAVYAKELGPCTGCDDVALARYGSRGAWIWIRNHVTWLPKLAWWKIANTVAFADEAGLIGPVFLLAVIAPLVVFRRREFVARRAAAVFAVIIVLDFLVIAITWSMRWRFVVPVEPLLSVGAGIPLASWIFGESSIAGET